MEIPAIPAIDPGAPAIPVDPALSPGPSGDPGVPNIPAFDIPDPMISKFQDSVSDMFIKFDDKKKLLQRNANFSVYSF